MQINLTGSGKKKNEADLCRSLGFNHTNDEIHIPRAPREEEREILDEIFKDSEHFSKLKSCAKLTLIFSKIIGKNSQGPNCQAQLQLQLQLQLELRLALIPISPASHPPTHPSTPPKKYLNTI